MRQSLKLDLSVYDLSKETKALLENGSLCQEDYRSYWADITSILDGIAGDQFPEVSIPDEAAYDKPVLKDIPAAWWKLMKFSPEMEKAMKKFWKKNPTGSIEWN
jgi:hypothetical protein